MTTRVGEVLTSGFHKRTPPNLQSSAKLVISAVPDLPPGRAMLTPSCAHAARFPRIIPPVTKMRSVLKSLLLGVILVITSQSVLAQVGTTVDLGVRLGTDLAGDIEDEFLGVDVRIGVASLPVVINPAFDFYFASDPEDFYQVSVNALYAVKTAALPTIAPYVGAGLGISRRSIGDLSNSDIGINLIGGGAITVGSLKPFAQVQLTLGDLDLVTLAIGVHAKISG